MTELLKDMFFTQTSINEMADILKKYYPAFDKEKFISLVFDDTFGTKKLKEKMRHTTQCLHETLHKSFEEALDILKKAAPYIKGFEAMTLPDYVELYGMENWGLSLPALGYFTKFASSEFAIRPFIANDPERAMAYMSTWAEDEDPKVRRFASEGCRPRLPWAMALPVFKKDPSLILRILEKLKNDESDFVKKSVANNLNDISKDNPEVVLDVCEQWYGHSKNIDQIVKHGCRTLLKSGNKRALLLFGFCDPKNLHVENLKLNKKTVAIGENVHFSFELIVKEKKTSKIRLEYCVYYVKSGGKLSKKVFQIIEKNYKPGKHLVSRKQTFQNMSTRKHYPGIHQILIIVNGVEMEKVSFKLLQKDSN